MSTIEEPRSLYSYIHEAFATRKRYLEHYERGRQLVAEESEARHKLQVALRSCGLRPGDLVRHGDRVYTIDETGCLDPEAVAIHVSALMTPELPEAVEEEPYRSDLDLIRAARDFAPPPPTTCADPLCHRDPRVNSNAPA